MMKAVALKFKTREDSIVNIDKPIPSSSEILVRVKKSALDTSPDEVVNKSMTGFFVHAKTNPLVLGWHYVGAVESIGADVKDNDLNVGDLVWGFLQYAPNQKQGAFSEYITIKDGEYAKAPENVSLDVLAAAGTETVTALQGMCDCGNLTKGKSILILGGGGGVGSAAVQIAKQLGAHVTAVCSTKDVERVKKFGADVVIDRSKNDIFSQGLKFDVIFDTPAKYSAFKCLQMLNAGGTYVVTIPSLGFLLAKMLSWTGNKNVAFVECHANRKDLETIGGWLSDGEVQIEIDSTFPIKDMKNALERQNQPSKVGRVVIQVEGGW